MTTISAVDTFAARLRGVTGDAASKFASIEVPRGTVVQAAGGRPAMVYLLESGAAKVCVQAPDGRNVIAGLLRGGALINAAAALAGTATMTRVATVVPTRLMAMPRPWFIEQVGNSPAFGPLIHQAISFELNGLYSCIGALITEPASQRLCRLLTQMIDPDEAGNAVSRVSPWLTRDEMAESIGCTRVYLTKLLTRLEEDGRITRRRGWILIRTSGPRGGVAQAPVHKPRGQGN